MNADNLLLWMSARKQGSWQQFRAAVEEQHFDASAESSAGPEDAGQELGFPIYHELRLNLQRLAHAEFFARDGQYGWRIAPPSLSLYAGPTERIGVLCGARTLEMEAHVTSAARNLALQMSEMPQSPRSMIVTGADDSVLRQMATECQLQTQESAPLSILLALPSLIDETSYISAELPVGDAWSIERFSTSKRVWLPVTQDEARQAHQGLFRFRHQYRREFYLKRNGKVSTTSSQTGKFSMLRRKRLQVMEFDHQHFALRLPASCRPPLLVERALVLCSGRLPSYSLRENVGFLEYSNVSAETAQAAAAVLGQKLQ